MIIMAQALQKSMPMNAIVSVVFLFSLSLVSGVSAQQTLEIKPSSDTSFVSDEVKKFCSNIADAARDQRYLLQRQELEKLEKEIDKRIELLVERRQQYEVWLKQRDAFASQAQDGLINIYKNMKPDAAASQLELIRPEIAAAIIMKLSPRLSSTIMNEMDAKKAAELAGIIASAGDKQTGKNGAKS